MKNLGDGQIQKSGQGGDGKVGGHRNFITGVGRTVAGIWEGPSLKL